MSKLEIIEIAPEKKVCVIRKFSTGWGWDILDYYVDDIEIKCILGVHYDKKVNIGSLLNYRKFGRISLADYRAIRKFDEKRGKYKHLKQIERLAKYLGDITLEVKEVYDHDE